jgi:hypothetical protein
VLVTRWEWDGRDRRRGTEPGARAGTPGDVSHADHIGAAADGPAGVVGEPGRAAVADGTGAQESLWT